jgi:hypothetical protein
MLSPAPGPPSRSVSTEGRAHALLVLGLQMEDSGESP